MAQTDGPVRTVGEVADAVGVTVRTLHHYDALGLVVPSARSGAGYRLYTAGDLARLRQVVVYRGLGFSLDEIAALLADGCDVVTHLRRQREAVLTRLDELGGLVRAIDTALENEMNDRPVTDADMRELFGEGFDDAHAEAEQRWGDTDAWRESARRTASFTKADWEEVKAEADAVHETFLAAFRSGLPASSPEAMAAAEQHRRHIDARFYDCPPPAHRGLGDLYVSDPRYTATYDESLDAPGLSSSVRDAIHANADRLEQRGS